MRLIILVNLITFNSSLSRHVLISCEKVNIRQAAGNAVYRGRCHGAAFVAANKSVAMSGRRGCLRDGKQNGGLFPSSVFSTFTNFLVVAGLKQ